MTELLNALRVANVGLGLLCLLLCVTKASLHWRRFNRTAKGFTSALGAFALATAWGTSEQLALGIPPGTRTVVTSFALVNLLYALWRTRGMSFYAEFTDENRVR